MLRRHTVFSGQVDVILSFTSNFVANIKLHSEERVFGSIDKMKKNERDSLDTTPLT